MSDQVSKPTLYVQTDSHNCGCFRPVSRSEVIEALGIDYEAATSRIVVDVMEGLPNTQREYEEWAKQIVGAALGLEDE